MKDNSFKSRLGSILVCAGCAIGIGNVWKFPYITGQNGGALFVIIYLVFLAIMGIPVLTMELAVGRASRRPAVSAYKELEGKGGRWHIHGWFAIAGNYLLMMYYTTVSGWMLLYFLKFMTGGFHGSGIDSASVFAGMLADPTKMGIAMALTVLLGFTVCSFELQKGLERITKVIMAGLLILIIVLAAHSIMLPGASEGLRFYLLPNADRMMEAGFIKVCIAAMNQAFFTLSLGIASMEIFGSYMSKEKTLATEATWICSLDTFVAIFSGLIIFPACFSYGVQPNAGPALLFITLPDVFMNMKLGSIWGTLFFLFMSFASFSTVIAVFENIIACTCDSFGCTRRKAALVNCIVILVASVPCVLGYNVWSGLRLIGGRDVLDSEDFLVSNILLPLGSLVYLLFCTSRWGWGFDRYLTEVNTGNGMRLSPRLKVYLRYILPILLLSIFICGLVM